MKKGKQKFLVIRLNNELHHRIQVMAMKEKLTIQEWFNIVLCDFMKDIK